VTTPSPIRVLYIDDDAGLRRLVERGLAREGYDVECAPDGAAGLTRIAQGGIDIVALDHYMPELDGMKTLERIKDLPDAPPTIFVTGAQESSIAVAALKAGAADYVVKDIEGHFIPLLRAAIDHALAAAQMRRQKEAAEQEVREARDRFEALATERAMLLREVNHRVGNSLQLIAAMLQLQSATATDEVKAALTAAMTRVMAVAQIHKRLYTSDDVQTVSVDQYLSALVEDLSRSSDGSLTAVTLSADPIELDPDRTVAIGVIVNELIINALKYAYPNGKGPIRVGLARNGSQLVTLTVEDEGVGAGTHSGTNPGSTGLGQRIVKAMAAKLGAEVQYHDARPGMRVAMSFNISEA